MIKLKSYGFQGVNVVAEIEYDHAGTTYTFNPVALQSQVNQMTPAQIKNWIKNEVVSRRGQMDQQTTDTLLGPIVNQELEP